MTSSSPNLLSIEIGPVLRFLDRKDWNSFVRCSKEIHKASQLLLPPWPENCRILESVSTVRPAWSPDGTKIALKVDSHQAQLCHPRQSVLPGRIMRQPCPGGTSIVALAFSPNGKLLVVAAHKTVRVWTDLDPTSNSGDYRLLQEWDLLGEVERHEGGRSGVVAHIHGVKISPNGEQLVVVLPQKALLKDIHTGATTRSIALPRGAIHYGSYAGKDVFFARDGQAVLFGGSSGLESREAAIKCWRSSEAGAPLVDQWVDSPRGQWGCAYVKRMAMCRNGSRLAASSSDCGSVWLFLVDQTGDLHLKATLLRRQMEAAVAVNFTQDDTHAIVVGRRQADRQLVLELWSFQDSTLRKTIVMAQPKLGGRLDYLSFSPDGQRAVLVMRTEEPYWSSGYYEIVSPSLY